MMKKTIKLLLPLTFFLILVIAACLPNDGDYSAYLDKAEAIYPGRPDSVIVMPGYNRANINALMSTDPRAVKIRLYWNSRRDSLDAVISKDEIANRKIIQVPNIPEGVYTFELVTFDKSGNKSVVTEKTGQVLGPVYVKGLANRIVKSKVSITGSPAIIWYSETDTSSVMAGTEVAYKLSSGDSARIFTSKRRDTTILKNAAAGGKLILRTAYLPPNAIDTFYAKRDTIAY
ncbi:uncharacterized protein DUF4998 [Arcticibacter tournemirensis]|uniref:DUF4998 domain-containing protein n=2 Tax=Arcticibacter tournemirensis TaxID=699437 RepID=A0A5M9H4D0_9SPHI|nr:DUF4998 domain-containing protein [Arcticibacter tournemirensis]KAA8481786.1 hypothetical protein F1649_13650 [Arcticibacter tournemirensis]TQM50179.1 uncharacterized protein DUF4998 [Arcticibacter tournemirensis]